MSDFSFIWATFIVVLISFIPGFLLAYPLLRRTGLRLLEIIAFGFMFGFFIPPAMLFFESLAGIHFSFGLVLVNIAIIIVIGAVLTLRETKLKKEVFSFSMNLDEISSKLDFIGTGKKNWVWLVLIIALLFAYWVRIIGFKENPYPHSPDPYSYLVTTRFIIKDGFVPEEDDLAWFPIPETHRERPLMQYMLAEWYSFYTLGKGEFDRLLLLRLADIYPALFGALGCLMLFILLSRYVGDKFGLFGALQGTLLPITVMVVAWGPEQVPWGIFAMLAFFASYILLIKEERWRYAILCSVAMLGVGLGSKSDLFAYSVFSTYVFLQGTLLFFTGKINKNFVFQNALIGATAIVSLLAYYVYRGDPNQAIFIFVIGPVILYSGALFMLKSFAPKMSKKNILNLIMILLLVGVLVYLSPVGRVVDKYVDRLFHRSNLFSTIAEHQTMEPEEYVLAYGPVGFSIADIKVIDIVMFLFLLFIAFDFVYVGSAEAIFFSLIVLPLYLLFSYQLKFISYMGPICGIALTICFGRMHALTGEIIKERKEKINSANQEILNIAIKGTAVLLVLFLAYQSFSMFSDISPFILTGTSAEKTCKDLKNHPISDKIFCTKIPGYWIRVLDWIRENTSEEEAVLVWWDYGHWINYVAERKTVIRNDLAHHSMVQDVAYLITRSDPKPLIDYMKFEENGKKRAAYLLFDGRIIDKWNAITYIACLREGNVTGNYGVEAQRSQCEKDLDFEFFRDKKFSVADYCIEEKKTHFMVSTNFGRTYCVPATFTITTEIFDKNMENPMNVSFHMMSFLSGNMLGKAFLVFYGNEDAKKYGGVYSSIFYKGWYLGEIPGFKKVYSLDDEEGRIVIYKVE